MADKQQTDIQTAYQPYGCVHRRYGCVHGRHAWKVLANLTKFDTTMVDVGLIEVNSGRLSGLKIMMKQQTQHRSISVIVNVMTRRLLKAMHLI